MRATFSKPLVRFPQLLHVPGNRFGKPSNYPILAEEVHVSTVYHVRESTLKIGQWQIAKMSLELRMPYAASRKSSNVIGPRWRYSTRPTGMENWALARANSISEPAATIASSGSSSWK